MSNTGDKYDLSHQIAIFSSKQANARGINHHKAEGFGIVDASNSNRTALPQICLACFNGLTLAGCPSRCPVKRTMQPKKKTRQRQSRQRDDDVNYTLPCFAC
jgi:hypothetical protein